MLTGRIEFTGSTLDDCALAIDEAKRRILDTFTSGADRNDSGSFHFEVEGNEEVVADG